MINIVIKEPNVLYRHGLYCFLADIFFDEFQQGTCFSIELNPESICWADIIILSVPLEECESCFSELKGRKTGIIIVLVNDEGVSIPSCSFCLPGSVFISRRLSLNEFRKCLLREWRKTQLPNYQLSNNYCCNCQYQTLSLQQLRIMSSLYKGKSTLEIANELMISNKTVFTHKYRVMKKFGLRSDVELRLFLIRLAEKKFCPIMCREISDDVVAKMGVF